MLNFREWFDFSSLFNKAQQPAGDLSVRQIIYKYTNGSLNSTPSYYAGRGNHNGDLNSKRLEMVYRGIKTEKGADAAKAFVNMVGDMTADASATTFLVSLYRLEANGWQYSAGIVPRNEAETMAESVSHDRRMFGDQLAMAAAMGAGGIIALVGGGIQGSVFGPKEGEGMPIIGAFMKKHAAESNQAAASKLKPAVLRRK